MLNTCRKLCPAFSMMSDYFVRNQWCYWILRNNHNQKFMILFLMTAATPKIQNLFCMGNNESSSHTKEIVIELGII